MIQILANSIIDGALIAVLAICFGLIYNTLKVFHFAFGAFFVFSGYLWFQGLSYFSFLIIGLIILVIEIFIYYPLSKKRSSPAVSLISSLGLYIIIINIIAMVWGNETKILSPVIHPTSEFLGIILTKYQIEIFLFSLLFISIILTTLKFSKIGNKCIAVGENLILSKSLGINIKTVRLFIICTATLMSSFMGLLKAFDVGLDPYVGMNAMLTAVVAFIISGGKKYTYAVIAGIFLGITRNLAIWYISAQWMDAVTFIILILFLLYKNKGMFMDVQRLEEKA